MTRYDVYDAPRFERQVKLYEQELGPAARARQEELRQTRHSCCWSHIEEGHNPACPNAPEPGPVEIPGQSGLL